MNKFYRVSYEYWSDYTKQWKYESNMFDNKDQAIAFLEDAPYNAKNLELEITQKYQSKEDFLDTL